MHLLRQQGAHMKRFARWLFMQMFKSEMKKAFEYIIKNTAEADKCSQPMEKPQVSPGDAAEYHPLGVQMAVKATVHAANATGALEVMKILTLTKESK